MGLNDQDLELTDEELEWLPDGSVVQMGCRNCEGGENHIKENRKWKCQWCGHKE